MAPLALSMLATLASMSSGTVSTSRSAAAGDRRRLLDRHAGQQLGGAPPGGIGLAGDGDDLVAGRTQRGGQDGTDAARADDAHPEVGHVSHLSFQSTHGYRTT